MAKTPEHNQTIRIAHFSDPHIIYLRHAWYRMHNSKQFFGLLNWVLRRRRKHRRSIIRHTVEKIIQEKCDLAVVTGDICQLAMPYDYAAFARMLKPLTACNIPVVTIQGNHDHYSGRQDSYTAYDSMRENLCMGLRPQDGVIEFKNLELVCIDAAVTTPSFKCYGVLDKNDVEIIDRRLSATSDKLRIGLGHFPILNKSGEQLAEFMAMQNSELALALMQKHNVASYLCGHIHKPFTVELPGNIRQYCSGTITGGGVLRIFEASKSAVNEIKSCHTF